MKTVVHPKDTRGSVNHGWLHANHSFSFANWRNPERMGFGQLRVWNDDVIQGGYGFGMHPHRDMEIVTVMLEGRLRHKDDMGNEGTISPGEVQVMSAGTGVMHSEFNDLKDDATKLFQIWVFPDKANVEPRYDQRKFDAANYKGQFKTLVGPKGHDDEDAMWIHQNAYFRRGLFDADATPTYELADNGQGVYLMVASGKIEVDGHTLSERDAIGVWDTDSFTLKVLEDADLVAVEVPMQ
ncbi:MAG: pirin family protein [Bacteroidota bacterium]